MVLQKTLTQFGRREGERVYTAVQKEGELARATRGKDCFAKLAFFLRTVGSRSRV